MFKHFAAIASGISNGISGAMEGAAASIAGVTVLPLLGYTNVEVSTIICNAMVGNGLISGVAGSYSKNLSCCGFFRNDYQKNISATEKIFLSSAYIGFKVLSVILGHVIRKLLSGNAVIKDDCLLALTLGSILILVPMWKIDSYLYKNVAAGLKLTHELCDEIACMDEDHDMEEPEEPGDPELERKVFTI